MSTNPRDILIKPLITEKTNDLMGENKYTFIVAKSANKIEIQKAVEEIFKVKVLDVNTINILGKVKRMGRTSGKRSDYKKAIVKLAEGYVIKELKASL